MNFMTSIQIVEICDWMEGDVLVSRIGKQVGFSFDMFDFEVKI